MDFNPNFMNLNDSESYDLTTNVSLEERDIHEINKIISDYMKRERTFDFVTEVILKCLYILLMMSGIVTNIIIICVIAINKKLLTSNNLLLINLFVSDILLCIFCMPFTLVAIIRRSWAFGAFVCKLVPFIQAVTTFVSAATISSIAIDRMNQITSNQFTARSFVPRTLSRSPKLIQYGHSTIIIWVISLVLSAPICIYQKVVEFGIKDLILYDKCVENWPKHNRGIYSFVILITQLLIPSSVMIVAHYRIRGHLNRHQIHGRHRTYIRRHSTNSFVHSDNRNNDNNIEQTQRDIVVVEDNPTNSSATVNCFLKPICDINYFNKELHRNNRITLFLLTVTIIFGISWLPWNLFNVYVDFYPEINMTPKDLYLVLAVCHLIAMSSATTNAIFYGFLHTGIRKEMRTTVRKIKEYFH